MSEDDARFVIPPPPRATIAVAGTNKIFPVRRADELQLLLAGELLWRAQLCVPHHLIHRLHHPQILHERNENTRLSPTSTRPDSL